MKPPAVQQRASGCSVGDGLVFFSRRDFAFRQGKEGLHSGIETGLADRLMARVFLRPHGRVGPGVNSAEGLGTGNASPCSVGQRRAEVPEGASIRWDGARRGGKIEETRHCSSQPVALRGWRGHRPWSPRSPTPQAPPAAPQTIHGQRSGRCCSPLRSTGPPVRGGASAQRSGSPLETSRCPCERMQKNAEMSRDPWKRTRLSRSRRKEVDRLAVGQYSAGDGEAERRRDFQTEDGGCWGNENK